MRKTNAVRRHTARQMPCSLFDGHGQPSIPTPRRKPTKLPPKCAECDTFCINIEAILETIRGDKSKANCMIMKRRPSVFVCIAIRRSTIKNNIIPYREPEAPTAPREIKSIIGSSSQFLMLATSV
jgi:hypothetical protein